MEFLGLFIPLGGAALVLLLLARLIAGTADKGREAAQIAAGHLEFRPNRRSYWGVYLFIACFVFTAIVNLVHAARSSANLAVAGTLIGFVLLLLMAFPATIVADEQGLEQVYWLRGRKRIAWKEVSSVYTDEKTGEVIIIGRSGVKIVHTRQLPAKETLLAEVEKHHTERAAATVAPPAFAMSGPAA